MIAIIWPSDDVVRAGFCMCLSALIAHCHSVKRNVVLNNPRCSDPREGRAMGVANAIKAQATHILWLDSDMEFPADTLERLLAHQKDIVGAGYRQRRAPFLKAYREQSDQQGNLVRAEYLPGGCLLVHTAVYEALGKPYYKLHIRDEQVVSEDRSFCESATELGYELWLDRSLTTTLKHLGEYRFSLDPSEM